MPKFVVWTGDYPDAESFLIDAADAAGAITQWEHDAVTRAGDAVKAVPAPQCVLDMHAAYEAWRDAESTFDACCALVRREFGRPEPAGEETSY